VIIEQRGHHDVLRAVERLQEMFGDRARLRAKAAVERRLSAASLIASKFDRAAESLQHVRHGDPDGGKHLVDDAGYEE
jgi:hypothetical protein